MVKLEFSRAELWAWVSSSGMLQLRRKRDNQPMSLQFFEGEWQLAVSPCLEVVEAWELGSTVDINDPPARSLRAYLAILSSWRTEIVDWNPSE